jgi:acyl-CoA thioester hydrolase
MVCAMNFAAPIDSHRETVRPEWIDYNGHMNVAYYVLVFDHATDVLFEAIGAGEAYRRATEHSLYAVEMHITYRRELQVDAPLRLTTQLLDHDAKRLHYIHHMYHAEDGYLAATDECLSMHVDMTAKRATAMPGEMAARLATLMEAHRHLPRPKEVGASVGIRRAG